MAMNKMRHPDQLRKKSGSEVHDGASYSYDFGTQKPRRIQGGTS